MRVSTSGTLLDRIRHLEGYYGAPDTGRIPVHAKQFGEPPIAETYTRVLSELGGVLLKCCVVEVEHHTHPQRVLGFRYPAQVPRIRGPAGALPCLFFGAHEKGHYGLVLRGPLVGHVVFVDLANPRPEARHSTWLGAALAFEVETGGHSEEVGEALESPDASWEERWSRLEALHMVALSAIHV